MRPRVIIAEDYEPTQEAIRHLIETEYEILVVVSDGRAAVEAVCDSPPM